MEEKKSEAAPATTPSAPSAPFPAPRDSRDSRDSRPPFGRRRHEIRRKVCRLCADHIDKVDYKNSPFLKTFTMDSGKILSRRITGTCAKHQRQLTRAIKRNRNIAILPYAIS